ncbi:MAG: ABC transporter substrate-binding protein [Erysipelotrichaceae bacterium]|nr:ABC transporter substrate-binding protein [Erysipelotrichaceae bacterium]
MKKIMLVLLALILLLAGCAGNNDKEEKVEPGIPETAVIRLALNDSGHILNFIAENQGYLEEEGIKVEYVYVSTDAEVFEGLRRGKIDIASNSGTNLPLQELSSGLNLTIFGGYLLTGCMPVFARVETEWNGIDDLIGKTMACEPNLYAITGPLLDKGYDPLNQINWYQPENQNDRIAAVKSGEADFGLVGTALNYKVLQDPELKIVTYAADILPDYSCCRVEALTSWVNKNPNTVKALLRAWIRAMEYYNEHHEEVVRLTSKKIEVEEAHVRAYLDNPRFNLNTDPMLKSVKRAWDYMDRLGLLNEVAKQINIEYHVNVDLYKSALDDCTVRYGKDNPKFYEKLQAQYARNN